MYRVDGGRAAGLRARRLRSRRSTSNWVAVRQHHPARRRPHHRCRRWRAAGVFASGQACFASSRLLVPRDKLNEAEEIARATAESCRIGDPTDPSTALGPLVSRVQQQRVRDYIVGTVAQGASLGGVFSADVDHATAVARRLRTGRVDINGAANKMLAPFGGFKQSGIGREFGWAGFEEFLEIKAIQY